MLEVIKFSKKRPKLSILVQDWSVRENFQLIHYLNTQSIEQSEVETVFIEYYDQINSKILKDYYDCVDTVIKLNFDKNLEYSKHLMFNVGIAVSRGDIFCICDSDAMLKKDFAKYIIDFHDKNKDSYLHIDQFRNYEKKYFPFNYPDIEEVIKNSRNFKDGKTLGVLDDGDPAHQRNHGACGSANINNLLKICGADESKDFLGHICGNDDLSCRMINAGMSKKWSGDHFIAHTWHPNSEGQVDKSQEEFWGPHDGRGKNLCIINSILTGRTKPLVKNKFLAKLTHKKKHFSLMEENKNDFDLNIVDYDRYNSFKREILIKSTFKYKNIKIIDNDISKFQLEINFLNYENELTVIIKK